LALYAFVVEVWRVPDDDALMAASLEPLLRPGDWVVVMRRPSVTRGILVRCADPDAPGRFVVARAIAHDGDRIELAGDRVSLDGRQLTQVRACPVPELTVRDPRADAEVSLTCSIEDYGDFPYRTLRVPEALDPKISATADATHWFLVSDNRHVHLDSRDYGPIDPRTCQHIVFLLAGASGLRDAERRLQPIW
jgi:signal peptidase I